MHIAVLGLEDFGFHLACTLSQLGDDIMAVDRDESRVQEIMRHVNKAVVADVADREALKDLGIRGMDVVAVDVGERFEISVLLTHYLQELGIPRILVKVANEDQGKILTMIGASDVVQPEREIAVKTAHLIHYSRLKLLDTVALGDGYFAITVQVPASLVGRRLGDLDMLERHRVQVIAIRQAAAKTAPFVPTADYVLLQDDLMMVMGEEAKLVEIHQKWK
ncbi:MAG TPA: TrkA family potassium uptake protein [Candidatus Competibacteraceae bacterium]|nr:MAG: TrkA family potassium uptake protein [Candidatus Competibacteraceae bacterium]HOB60626.1 TrkA family potassium uptake protein [Candidatus Competibacteraceae bacterium]HQA24920.1 TrkA family potassium uptake protein [Candidatus Competibacteraceae bacterium]HQD56033.1 TrkA family potassium uptake protein [Candidatus Competibacteraceae bacterium]